MTVITKSLMDSIMGKKTLQYLGKSVYRGQELVNDFGSFSKIILFSNQKEDQMQWKLE